MTEELKPCPFCGSEPFMEKSTRYPKPRQEPVDGYTVVCKNFDCIGCMSDNWYRRSEKAAAKEWNTRYKRTCHQTNEGDCIKCSECGNFTTTRTVSKRFMPRFCGSCGAEVVYGD